MWRMSFIKCSTTKGWLLEAFTKYFSNLRSILKEDERQREFKLKRSERPTSRLSGVFALFLQECCHFLFASSSEERRQKGLYLFPLWCKAKKTSRSTGVLRPERGRREREQERPRETSLWLCLCLSLHTWLMTEIKVSAAPDSRNGDGGAMMRWSQRD